MALLAFLQAFRKVYIGEHVMHATKVRKIRAGGVSTFGECVSGSQEPAEHCLGCAQAAAERRADRQHSSLAWLARWKTAQVCTLWRAEGRHVAESGRLAICLLSAFLAQVYSRLGERLGITDHSMVLNLIVNKIAANLRLYGSCDEIIQATLTLFQVGQACGG